MDYDTLYLALTTTLCPFYAFAILQVASIAWTTTSGNAPTLAIRGPAVARVFATSSWAFLPDLSSRAFCLQQKYNLT